MESDAVHRLTVGMQWVGLWSFNARDCMNCIARRYTECITHALESTVCRSNARVAQVCFAVPYSRMFGADATTTVTTTATTTQPNAHAFSLLLLFLKRSRRAVHAYLAHVSSRSRLGTQIFWRSAVREAVINPRPVFVLGHPRTGTTLLHTLLALDTDRFVTHVHTRSGCASPPRVHTRTHMLPNTHIHAMHNSPFIQF